MIVIYGRRSYGRVDEHGGEYAQTAFAHIYYMPLIPVSSFWVNRSVGGTNYGLPIKLHWRSVAAAYLRTWAIVVAIGLLLSPSVITGVFAMGLIAASVMSYTWRALRNAKARRRSDFNLLAFGTRCDPSLVTRDTRADLKASLDKRLAALGTQRPPDDVARFGAVNLDEAVIAYGLLRIAALDRRGGPEAAAAERLLDGNHEVTPEGEGPYRRTEGEARDAAVLHDQAAAVAAHHAARVHGARVATSPRTPWWKYRGSKIFAVLLLGVGGFGTLVTHTAALRGTREVGFADVVGSANRYVAVTCDDTSDVGELYEGRGVSNKVTDHVFDCHLGDHHLLVLTPPSVTELGTRIEGKLCESFDREPWPGELRELLANTPLYLDVHGRTEELIEAIAGGVVGLLGLGLAVYWVRARRLRAVASPA